MFKQAAAGEASGPVIMKAPAFPAQPFRQIRGEDDE
jgi:hypothetical protein